MSKMGRIPCSWRFGLLLILVSVFVIPNSACPEDLEDATRTKRAAYLPDTANPSKEEQQTIFWTNKAQNILKDQLQKNKLNKRKAKNAIIFMGDGMSIATQTATRMYLGNENLDLSFEEFPYTGLAKTYCVNAQVADSACSGTAYLSGVKANYLTTGVSPAVKYKDCVAESNPENHVDSIIAWAQKKGKATGVVTTTIVNHASPASTFAHSSNCEWYSDQDILDAGQDPNVCTDPARQMVRGEVGKKLNVIFGGGWKHFLPNTMKDRDGVQGRRADGVDLLEEWRQTHNTTGIYVDTKKKMMAVDGRKHTQVLGLFSSNHLPYHTQTELNAERPTLEEMVSKAMDVLEQNGQGYVLFVEGGLIDIAHHNNFAKRALDETAELHKAVKMARKRTSEDDTLIVVTADHAHTLTLSGYSSRGNDILGLVDGEIGDDGLPFAILSYANGPGNKHFLEKDGTRKNLTQFDMKDEAFRFPSTVPYYYETHGGDDVAVYASGPWAHLFTGNYEQHLIPHAIGYATCLGDGLTMCSEISHHTRD